MARDSPLRPVVPARIAAASIPGSRCGDGTSLVAIEGFLRFSVSHETTSPVPEHTAKHPLAFAGRFLVKTGSRRGLLLSGRIKPASALKRVAEVVIKRLQGARKHLIETGDFSRKTPRRSEAPPR